MSYGENTPTFSSCSMAWVCTQQQSSISLVTAVHGLGCVDSLLSPCSSWVVTRNPHPHHSPVSQDGGVLLPGSLQHVLGSLAHPERSNLCVRHVCFPTDLLELLCSRQRVPISMPSTSYSSGRHSTGLIPIVNSEGISVLVKENVGCIFSFLSDKRKPFVWTYKIWDWLNSWKITAQII